MIDECMPKEIFFTLISPNKSPQLIQIIVSQQICDIIGLEQSFMFRFNTEDCSL